MTLRKILALTCLLLPMMASAHQFETGQRVPPIGITDRGELVLDKDQFSYKTWNSAQLVGKVRVLQHIAGRTSAKEKNATLIEAIKSAKLPHDRYQTTTIVNTDDAIPGSGMFVRSSLESNKKLYPWSQFIVDSNGVARGAWQLDEKSSAVVVLDKDGRVQWAKDGALTQEEVQQQHDQRRYPKYSLARNAGTAAPVLPPPGRISAKSRWTWSDVRQAVADTLSAPHLHGNG